MKYKKTTYLLLCLLIVSMIFSFTACSYKTRTESPKAKGRLVIYTTFYPLYDFTKKIVQDTADVEIIVPAGVEPHDFEPSLKQVADIHEADMFIYLDPCMEPWAEKLKDTLTQKEVIVVKAGAGIVQNNDPHIWLDPILAKKLSHKIYDAIVMADKDNKDVYEQNMAKLDDMFDELDEVFKAELSGLVAKDIVTTHDAFGYLAERYGLNQIPITGISPQQEPSPKKMAELVDICKQKGIKYIFTEALSSPKLSESLAEEAGVKTLVLNPIGGLTQEQIKKGKDYFSLMRENLENLKIALSE